MGFLDWLLQKFPRWRLHIPRQRQLSILEKLPPELIWCITDFLEKPDIICLTLCSYTLLNVIRKPALPTGDSSLRLAILTRIAGDLPTMFCCHYCVKLHPTADIHHPASTKTDIYHKCPDIGLLRTKPSPNYLLLFFQVHGMSSLYRFRHCHLTAVMKNHYHGHPHGRAVERLAYTEVMDWKFYPATTTLLSVEGRVCSLDEERSTLVLQIQNWVLFHDDPDVNTVMSTLGNIWICRHNRLDCNASGFDIRSAIQTRGFRLEKSNTFECMGCPICGIEFQFDLRDCGTDGKAVLVTKWLDLGAGLGFNDPKWKRIIPDILEYRERRQLITSSGDIGRLFRDASCIEGQASNPTERNQSYLMGKRYRRLMSPKLGNMYWALL